MLAVKILLIVSAAAAALFLLSLAIYFFNLDMKFAAVMTPVMVKFYDRKKRKKKERDERRNQRNQS